jgi:hypothetical protein
MEDETAHVNDFYSYKKDKDFKSELKSKKSEKDLYLDYLKKMRGIKKTEITSPGHLEAFLFGMKLYKKNQNNTNPRFFIYNHVKGHFTDIVQKRSETAPPSYGKNIRKDGINEIKPGKPVMKRVPIKGWSIILNGKEFFIIVGKDSQKSFCDVLSKDGYYPKEEELRQKGFEKRGGEHPYYIKKFKKNEVEEAIVFMNETKEMFSRH